MPPERKSRIERDREQREATWIEDATKRLVDSGDDAESVGLVLRTAASVLLDRGELHEEIKRTGWKASRQGCYDAAELVKGLVAMVETYVPPADIPEVAPIVPGRPGDTPEALRDRLAGAFGPNLDTPTYGEIQARTEREIDSASEPAPVCTMGPACPVHPGIEVIHPVNAPADAVVGPEGGDTPLPRDEEPTVQHVAPAMPAMSDANAPAPVRARLTYAEMYARRAAAPPADHRSVSQIQAAADCGVKLALYREPEIVPSWWFVAGTALHAWIEAYERALIAGADPIAEGHPWLPTFYAEIDKVRTATGVPTDRWRSARGGAEGYDWWRVEGEAILKRYIEWSTARHAAGWSILTVGETPVLEYPFRLDVQGIPVDGFIDQAWINADKIEIIDLKFGSSRPDDRFQIGVYAHALALAAFATGPGAGLVPTIDGAYYLGRKGELYGQADDLRAVVPWDDVVHRTVVTDMMDRGGLFLPRRSSFCKSCGVNDLCPAGAS